VALQVESSVLVRSADIAATNSLMRCALLDRSRRARPGTFEKGMLGVPALPAADVDQYLVD
jgi:hypothetical protein